MSDRESPSVEGVSNRVKAILYLGGVLLAAVVGAVATYQAVRDIADAPANIQELTAEIDALEDRIAVLEGMDLVTFDEPLHIRDSQQPTVLLTRQGGGPHAHALLEDDVVNRRGTFGSNVSMVWHLDRAESGQ